METQNRFTRLLEENDRLKADFVIIELSLAITFCQIALSTPDRTTADRNVDNARRARDAAFHALDRSPLELATRQAIEEKSGQLAELLEQLDGCEGATALP